MIQLCVAVQPTVQSNTAMMVIFITHHRNTRSAAGYERTFAVKFLPTVAPGGTVLIGDTVEIPEDARQDVTYVKVNCTEIATSLGNPKGANIVMTGAIIKLMGDFTHDAAVAAMNHMFAKKGKSKFNESNARAFDAGFNAV